MIDGGADVDQDFAVIDLLVGGDRNFEIVLVVAELEAGRHPVVERRREGTVACFGVAIALIADMGVDAEGFLNDDNAAASRAGGRGLIGADLMAVGGG